ncbi:MAG: hypothetical protein KVP17_000995 [Porospora cf. gigantea B]|uniref:uncharacterized protein n=1 Tax=Porospora cf. gigantea B TaxID=2853592 RepID=UPI0035717A9C|nr:MAG: hypothetical protein KVP17_000995 [Porospora cf. gigantea B]
MARHRKAKKPSYAHHTSIEGGCEDDKLGVLAAGLDEEITSESDFSDVEPDSKRHKAEDSDSDGDYLEGYTLVSQLTEAVEAADSGSEVCPGDDDFTMDDIMNNLQSEPSLAYLRAQTKQMGLKKTEKAPMSTTAEKREDRVARYAHASQRLKAWLPHVTHEKYQEQALFGEIETHQVGTKDIASSFKPRSALELMMEGAFETDGVVKETNRVVQGIVPNDNIRDAEKTAQVARLKRLLMEEERKRKRVAKIKSKTYRKVRRRASLREQEKIFNQLEQEDPEMARRIRHDWESKRAESRMMKQDHARKRWAKMATRYGGVAIQKEISRQANISKEEKAALDRVVKRGMDELVDSDSETLASDSEGDAVTAQQTLKKGHVQALQEIEDLDEEAPKDGILGEEISDDDSSVSLILMTALGF